MTHREGVERVVDLQLAHQARGEVVDERGHEADQDRAPHAHDGAAGGDAHQPAQQRVARVRQVVCAVASKFGGKVML